MAKRKGKKKGRTGGRKKGRKTLLVAAAVGVGLWLLLQKPKEGGVALSEKLKPASVKEGEMLGVTSYRLISERRPGMAYAKVTSGSAGGELQFEAVKSGMFTRNFVQEGGTFWAEIA